MRQPAIRVRRCDPDGVSLEVAIIMRVFAVCGVGVLINKSYRLINSMPPLDVVRQLCRAADHS